MTFTARRVVEIVGPAGAGKTTLLRALQERQGGIISELLLSRRLCTRILASDTVRWLRPFVSRPNRGRWFTWREIRSMIYLQGWHQSLLERNLSDVVVIFDHGPIYRLALLREFGPNLTRSARFHGWWDMEVRQWASMLNLVIWLDAPNAILLQRINGRADNHRMKGRPKAEICDFLGRYRASYEFTMKKVLSESRIATLKFDTGSEPLSEMAKAVCTAIDRQAVTC
jgi:shikimate kinase